MASTAIMRGPGRQPDLNLVVRVLAYLKTSFCDLISCGQSEDDFLYEQDIIRNPGSTKPWLAYIEFKLRHGSLQEQAFVMERACIQLPRSYKLWKMVRNLIETTSSATGAEG